MKIFSTSLCLIFFLSGVIVAQTLPSPPALTNTVGGVAWIDKAPVNGIRDGSETVVPGLLVKLLEGATVVSTALTKADGSFSLAITPVADKNYRIEYLFPRVGFDATIQREGADQQINSAAKPAGGKIYSALFTGSTIASNPTNYGLGLKAVADTRTFCDTKESAPTTWGDVEHPISLTLPKSTLDPVSVLIWASEAVLHPAAGIENTSTSGQHTYDFTFGGRISMTLPGNDDYPNSSEEPDLQVFTTVGKGGTLLVYDGATDFGGSSGTAFYNQFGFAVAEKEYFTDVPGMDVFSGTGHFLIPTEGEGVTLDFGGGNQASMVITNVAAGACVVYTYDVGVLPVTMTSFTAKAEGETANLVWTTTSESNSDKFEVQRSVDAKSWITLGTVKTHGETKDRLSYTFTDKSPVGGTNIYRLKIIDLDGTFAFSRMSSLQFGDLPASMTIYPNPVVNELSVKSARGSEIVSIELHNQLGQVVLRSTKPSSVNVEGLLPGLYVVRATNENGIIDRAKVLITR